MTETVQSKYHNRLVTPLDPYARLFSNVAVDNKNTLNLTIHYWRDGVTKYLELPNDSPLDLTEK